MSQGRKCIHGKWVSPDFNSDLVESMEFLGENTGEFS